MVVACVVIFCIVVLSTVAHCEFLFVSLASTQSVFSVPKKSVSQSMMEECRVFDPEYRYVFMRICA